MTFLTKSKLLPLVASLIFLSQSARSADSTDDPYLNFDEYNVLMVNSKLPNDFRTNRRRLSVHRVLVGPKADPALFESPKLFSKLSSVVLKGNGTLNAQMIPTLACNYPELRDLHITQEEPLSLDTLDSISSLKHLSTLSLSCKLEYGSMFSQLILPALTDLEIDCEQLSEWRFPALTRLRRLSILGRIDARTLDSIQAPNLYELVLRGENIAKDAFPAVAHFSHLKVLNIPHQPIDSSDYQLLRSMNIREIICHKL